MLKVTEVVEVKNMEFIGKEEYMIGGHNVELDTMSLRELSADRWNSYAERENIRMFMKLTGRKPASYEEVKAWVYDLIAKEKAAAVTATNSIQFAN